MPTRRRNNNAAFKFQTTRRKARQRRNSLACVSGLYGITRLRFLKLRVLVPEARTIIG
jgi:hypothetical protein